MNEQVKRYALLHGALEFADALCPTCMPRWVRAVDYDALAQRCRELEHRCGALGLELENSAERKAQADRTAETLRAEVERLRGSLKETLSEALGWMDEARGIDGKNEPWAMRAAELLGENQCVITTGSTPET